jgi:hypothetical protein
MQIIVRLLALWTQMADPQPGDKLPCEDDGLSLVVTRVAPGGFIYAEDKSKTVFKGRRSSERDSFYVEMT